MTGTDATTAVRVPDSELPADLDITADIAQHRMASPEMARRPPGWEHADPEGCVRASVRWHLDRPPATTGDFSADERALGAC